VFAILAGASAALWVGILRGGPARSIRPLAVSATLLFGLAYDAGLAYYTPTIHRRNDPSVAEMDVYRVALELMRDMPALQQSGPALFWYNNRVNNPINSVQSTYLWGFSRLNGTGPRDPGMPVFTRSELLRLGTTPYLGLLGESQQEVDEGIKALTSNGLQCHQVKQEVLASGGYKVYWDLVRLSKR
jgi:hypothetical protein